MAKRWGVADLVKGPKRNPNGRYSLKLWSVAKNHQLSVGNWFHDQCVAAGLPHCSSHGLRKSGATRLGNAGGTELEIMAFLGHARRGANLHQEGEQKTPWRYRHGEGRERKKALSRCWTKALASN